MTTIPAGGLFQTSCLIQFANLDALRSFLTRDNNDPLCSSNPSLGDPDDCYRNCASAAAVPALAPGVCPGGSPIHLASFATICNRQCELSVAHRVRCILDSCQAPTQFGPFVDSTTDPLQVAPGSCVQYEIEATNTGNTPLCRLRLDEALTNQPADVAPINGSTQFDVGGVPCAVPACFNTLGNPCEYDPATCAAFPNGQMQPGQTLRIRFSATIPMNANPAPPDPISTVVVDGASDCPVGGPVYTCADTAEVELDVRSVALQCDAKQWAFQADIDADCEPEPPFGPFSQTIDLRDDVFPVRLRLRLQATNTGQTPLQVVASDAALTNCVINTPGVDFVSPPACELGTSKLVPPGASAEWFCEIRIDSAAAARALDACDGAADGAYHNTASVSGTTVSSGTGVCVQATVFAGSQSCSATILVPPPCDIDVFKEVKCQTDADSAYAESVDAAPGTTLTYRVRVVNAGMTNVPQVCLTDVLSCDDWLVAGSVNADLAGTNANACLSAFAASLASGMRTCYTFAACRPAAPWIAPNETLTITFNVLVPANFNTPGQDPDCTNGVTAEAYSENCSPNPPAGQACAQGADQARFDVLLADIECAEDVCADLNGDSVCDAGPAAMLTLPSDTLFPVTLIYRSTVTNTGETPLSGARACDPNLVGDAFVAGLTFLSCDFCDGACDGGPGDDCADLGALPPNGVGLATCVIQVPSREAWEAFALTDTDGNENCYRTGIVAQANITAAVGLCTNGANTAVSSPPCLVNLCIQPPPPTGGCCLPQGQCLEVTEVDCDAIGGLYNGDGTLCEGDENSNGIDDLCEEAIPTVSEWGLILFALLLLVAGLRRFGSREETASQP
jgi:uncharacterized repeat protein (TIGR01451 family)